MLGLPMKITATGIDGLVTVDSDRRCDERGSFARQFCRAALQTVIGTRLIEQINVSVTSRAGSVRGLHFQHPPHAEMKLVRCLRGRVWDVAVDLRKGSETFLQWHAEELTRKNNRMFVIPEGFAHGFQALEDDCELLYLHTAAYAPDAEAGVRATDPRLDIAWPLPVSGLSQRDASHEWLAESFTGLVV